MKIKTTFFLALCLSLVLISTGCNKDTEEVILIPENEISIKGINETLTNAYIEDYGQNVDGSFEWVMILVSTGLDFVQGDFEGMGSYVYLHIHSNLETGLGEGVYKWSDDNAEFTVTNLIVAGDFNSETLSAELLTAGQSGSMTISLDGEDTVIDLDILTVDGDMLTAYYKGLVTKL